MVQRVYLPSSMLSRWMKHFTILISNHEYSAWRLAKSLCQIISLLAREKRMRGSSAPHFLSQIEHNRINSPGHRFFFVCRKGITNDTNCDLYKQVDSYSALCQLFVGENLTLNGQFNLPNIFIMTNLLSNLLKRG